MIMGRSPTQRFKIHETEAQNVEEDQWYPIASSRTAKWWYSTVHNVTVIVGAGVLNLPSAMSHLGWGPGLTVLTISWIITFYTLWQMIEMHETEDGRRFDRYHELGQYVFGQKLGLYVVLAPQLAVQIGANIVYMIVGGESLMQFYRLVFCSSSCKDIGLGFWILIFSSVHCILSHLPNLNSIGVVSLAAAIMSISYSTIIWATIAAKGREAMAPAPGNDCQHEAKAAARVLHSFASLGSVAFSFAGHNVVMEIQATIPSPSKKLMWKGVILAYVIVALCYFPIAIIGYSVLRDSVQDNILSSLTQPTWLMAMTNMFVVIHLIGSYQIYAMPVFDMMERLFTNKFGFRPRKRLSIILRIVYVAFTVIVAIFLPHFEALLGFFGGFAFAPTTYFLPCIIWLALFKPAKGSLSWWANWICIVLGVALMVVAPIGGLRQLIVDRRHCSMWKFNHSCTPCKYT